LIGSANASTMSKRAAVFHETKSVPKPAGWIVRSVEALW
jgi:hypothetical protein